MEMNGLENKELPIVNSGGKMVYFIFGILFVVLIIGLGVGSYFVWSNKNKVVDTPVVVKNVEPEKKAVLIYEQAVDLGVEIKKKVGEGQPETLTKVGKVGEMPQNYLLSKDRKLLLINYESKLQIMNMETKEIRDLYIPKRSVLSVSFSPNDKQLFIWDQVYAPEDGDYSFYATIYDLETGESRMVKQGYSKTPFFTKTWRDDNKVLMYESMGEYPKFWYFDLNDNQQKTPKAEFGFRFESQSGKVMAISKDWVDDICDDFSGSAISSYDIVDPVSGVVAGTIGGLGNEAEVIAISPDDNEVLYQTKKPWTSRDDCEKTAEQRYFRANLLTGSVENIVDISVVLKEWDSDYVGAELLGDWNNSVWKIMTNNQEWVVSNKNLRVIGEYFQ